MSPGLDPSHYRPGSRIPHHPPWSAIGAIELVLGGLLGNIAMVVFFAALGLAAGTVMPGQAAIAATGLGVFALVPALVGLIPVPIAPYLPTSILSWSLEAAAGVDAGWVTPLAWIAWIALLVGFATRRMNRLEL